MNWKLLAGIALGFGIGFGCRAGGIPAPAPPLLMGAVLVVAMTSGYRLADRYIAHHAATTARHFGEPTERSPTRGGP
jgi:XapX domain-containing protein